METALILLRESLTDENLNNLIETCTCLHTLNCLLQVKKLKILESSCEKKHFSIDLIYKNEIDIELANEILKSVLFVDADVNSHLNQTTEFCLNKLRSNNYDNLYYAVNLLNVIFEHCLDGNIELNLTEVNFEMFRDGILNILGQSSKPLVTFVLIKTIPIFLQFVKTSKNLEILCVCFKDLIQINCEETEFNLLKSDEYWMLIMEAIANSKAYLMKQASYLLLKSLEIISNHNKFQIPDFVKTTNLNDFENTWKNYLILLDTCSEKQLHLVEPSLLLFTSTMNLNFLWRLSLYKIFLNHPQNLVVYKVAVFILLNECEWYIISEIINDLLSALNKNEYNSHSQKTFHELGSFCHKLNSNQFEEVLRRSLNVAWVPAAVWCFYINIFNQKCNLQISLLLLEKVINRLKLIPHRFIREACKKIVLKHFINNCKVESSKDILKLLVFLEIGSNMCNEILWENFVNSHAEQIKFFTDELVNLLLSSLVNDDRVDNIKILLKLLGFMNVDISSKISTILNKTPVKNVLLLESFIDHSTLEKYLKCMYEQIQDFSDAVPFLLLSQKLNSKSLLKKATNFIKWEDSNIQTVLAFGISFCYENYSCEFILKYCKTSIFFRSMFSEDLKQFFVILLTQTLNSCSLRELEDCLIFFDSLLGYQNFVVFTLLENLTPFLKHVDDSEFLNYILRCFEEFLLLVKNNNCSKKFILTFLNHLFHTHLLENNKFSKMLLDFLQQFLSISNSSNSVACILSETLVKFLKENPRHGNVFIPFVVELLFYGITTNKNERVEYYICQEVELKLSSENNPNFEEMSVKLWAFDSLLILVNRESEHSQENADQFCTLLMKRYRRHFLKRFFPDSQILLEKLRIVQALLLLNHSLQTTKNDLIQLLIDSFINESHQPSVKHLMQWLLILLIKNNNSYINLINNKLKTIDNNRPSTVSGFIPVLYQLMCVQDENQWNELTEILLPYTMGAQFKLRIFSQVALIKIYERATKLKCKEYLEKYKFLYGSLREVVEATRNAPVDLSSVHHEFLDYFNIENLDNSTILYTIPKINAITETEWENLLRVSTKKHFCYLKFTHSENTEKPNNKVLFNENDVKPTENIQKKITPWKALLNSDSSNHTANFILVTSLVEKPANLGGLSRTCEVFGIKKMVMRTAKITSDREYKSLSMTSENWVEIIEVKIEQLQTFIIEIKKQDYCVIGAEQTAKSVKLNQFKFPKKTVLILGNEKEGIPADLIPILDRCVEIPQFGMVRSLNVHVAGAIFVWEYCKQHRL